MKYALVLAIGLFAGCAIGATSAPSHVVPQAVGVHAMTTPTWHILEAFLDQGCTPVLGTLTWADVEHAVQNGSAYPVIVIYQDGANATNTIAGCYKDYPQQLYSPGPSRRAP